MPSNVLVRSTRDRILTGLAGGMGSLLGIGSGAGRIIMLFIFLVSVFLHLWPLILAIYLIASAFIPREDDPEDVRVRGFVIDPKRIILSLLSLFFLGLGVFLILSSLWGIMTSIGQIASIAVPAFLVGVAGMLLAILALIFGLVMGWLGLSLSKKI